MTTGAWPNGDDYLMGRLLTFGETMAVAATAVGDPLRTTRQLTLSIAGAEATVAIGVARLGHDATWVGVVGADEIGARIRRELAAEHVDTRFIASSDNAATGLMVRERRTAEFTAVTYFRRESAGAQLTPADIEAALAGGVDLLHITGITAALSPTCLATVRHAVSAATAAGMTVSFDVNYRATLPGSAESREVARELLPAVDLLFVGEDELWVVSDEPDPITAATELLGTGPSEVIVKRGSAGAYVTTTAEGALTLPAVPVQVVDTIGAGDSFTAGYLAALLSGLPVAGRLQWALTCAACTVGTHGDWEGLPHRSEVSARATGAERTLR